MPCTERSWVALEDCCSDFGGAVPGSLGPALGVSVGKQVDSVLFAARWRLVFWLGRGER